MKKYLYIALAALGMMGCEEELYPDGDGVGTLVISGIEVETVVGDIQTKASMVEESVIPEASEFTIVAINTETQEETTLEIGINELEAGSYIVRATYGEEKGMSYTPYFSGEKKVTLTNGETRPVSLRPSLQNAILRPKLDETLINQYNNYALNIQKDDDKSIPLTNDKDFYLPVGTEGTYTLTLFGENKLGIMVSHDWTYQGSQFVAKTRYIVNCNPDLPSFTLPAQAETNAWSKFIYVTPMTVKDFSYIPDGMTTEEILANVVYEASTDGQTWIPAITDGDKVVIKGLEASTQYIIRARYGGVENSNLTSLITENGAQVAHSDMDTWDDYEVSSAYGEAVGNPTPIYCYYLGSKENHIWNTANEEGTNGATNTVANMGLWWRWCSGTIPTTDAVSGTAAEISTLAFYTDAVNNPTSIYLWDRNGVYNNYVYYRNREDYARKVIGTLYTGIDEHGTEHSARPISLSFYYKYAPCRNGDQCIAYAKVFDENGNLVAETEIFNSTRQDDYNPVVLDFKYEMNAQKISYIKIHFQAGSDSSVGNMTQSKASTYTASPYPNDRVVGSVLKIDNVTLNYDYE